MTTYLPLVLALALFPVSFLAPRHARIRVVGAALAGSFFLVDAFIHPERLYTSLVFAMFAAVLMVRSRRSMQVVG